MSLNTTPRGTRVHIAIFGRRNAGKSSIINAVTNQPIAVVSSVKGTTTDPVYKSMELLPIGPVVFIDTAGLDDVGELGELRKSKTYEVLNKTDIAILIIDAETGLTTFDKEVLSRIKAKKIPYVILLNKIDIRAWSSDELKELKKQLEHKVIPVSALEKTGIEDLKQALIKALPDDEDKFKLVGDLIHPGDFIVLVVPIDKAAPKGRLILPQQQVIRDVLESDAICVVTKEYELRETLEKLGNKPKLVITDSHVFSKVDADTPKDIPLTSFSILFARYKGDLVQLVQGAKSLNTLRDGDKILMAEACTHHRQSDDLGTVKIPRWIRQYTGKKLTFDHTSGFKYPENLQDYSLIVHCGACMLNRKEMHYRLDRAKELHIPIVNYGVIIAYTQGILKRAVETFPLAKLLLEED